MRLYILLTVLLCAITNVDAQKTFPEPLQKFLCSARLEVAGGPNFNNSKVNDIYSDDCKVRPGVNIGVQINTKLSENVTFTPGFKIDQKGCTDEYKYDYEYDAPMYNNGASGQPRLKSASFDGIHRKNLNTYFAIPLVFGVTPFSKARSIQFSAGVNPAFLLGSRTKTNSFGNITGTFGKEGIKKFDFGFLVGANYLFKNGVSLGAMYDHTITNSVDVENSTAEVYNRSIKLVLAYRINFNPLFIESYTPKRKYLEFK